MRVDVQTSVRAGHVVSGATEWAALRACSMHFHLKVGRDASDPRLISRIIDDELIFETTLQHTRQVVACFDGQLSVRYVHTIIGDSCPYVLKDSSVRLVQNNDVGQQLVKHFIVRLLPHTFNCTFAWRWPD